MNKVIWLFHATIFKDNKIRAASWIEALYRSLTEGKEFEIIYVIPNYTIKQTLKTIVNDKIVCYFIPSKANTFYRMSREMKQDIFKVIQEEKPKIIQVFGTEFSLGLATVCAAEEANMLDRTIIWLQGICSLIAKEYYSGLPFKIIYGYSLRDFLRKDNIYYQKKRLSKRAINELKMIQMSRHIIGRTDFDKAWVNSITHQANYYHCNDILRQTFYNGQWSEENCDKYRIFMSQGDYPIKGLHFALKALSILIQEFPGARLYVAGDIPIDRSNIKKRISESLYSKYLRKLIKKYGLERNVVFTGRLSSEEMKEQYLKANVFLSPSFVENSPNSLGEAMLLGVPCVTSNAGGVSNMLQHNREGFIFDKASENLMVYYIKTFFENSETAKRMGQNARDRALITHSEKQNAKELSLIYSKICEVNFYASI